MMNILFFRGSILLSFFCSMYKKNDAIATDNLIGLKKLEQIFMPDFPLCIKSDATAYSYLGLDIHWFLAKEFVNVLFYSGRIKSEYLRTYSINRICCKDAKDNIDENSFASMQNWMYNIILY